MGELEQRKDEALRRIREGLAPMRVPAETSDPDVVIVDLWAEVERLRSGLVDVSAILGHAGKWVVGCDCSKRFGDISARVARALLPAAKPAEVPAGKTDTDLLYEAWTVIANAHGGDWGAADQNWKRAAEAWRDRWHQRIGVRAAPPAEGKAPPTESAAVAPEGWQGSRLFATPPAVSEAPAAHIHEWYEDAAVIRCRGCNTKRFKPEDMHGACDEFGGTDYPDAPPTESAAEAPGRCAFAESSVGTFCTKPECSWPQAPCADQNPCPNCEALRPAGWTFCVECGKSIGVPTAASPEGKAPDDE